MPVTTAAALRTLVADLVATIDRPQPFREHRYEDGPDFIAWCEQHPTSALRRFSVRLGPDDTNPAVVSLSEEWREASLAVIVAYPRTNRYGELGLLSLDDTLRADQYALEDAIGLRGGHNYAGAATVLNAMSPGAIAWASGENCEFLVVTLRLGFWADSTAY